MLSRLLLLLAFCSPAAVAQPASDLEAAQQALFAHRPRVALQHLAAPSAPAAYYLKGRAHQALLQHRRAVAAFARADTSATHVLVAWGQSLHRLGRPRAARQRYQRAYRQDSSRYDAALPLAALYADAKRWAPAQAVLEGLLQEDPDNEALLLRLGKLQQAAGQRDEARRTYRHTLRANPRRAEAALQLGTLLAASDSTRAARRVLSAALRHAPRHAALWYQSGMGAFREAQYDTAATAFQRAIAAGDSSATTWQRLGMARFYGGASEGAVTALRRAHALDSTEARTTFYLGLAEKARGAPEVARRHLEQAVQQYGQTTLGDVHAHLADAYAQLGQYPQAIRSDRLALQLDPAKAAVRFHLATLYDDYYADPGPARNHYELFLDDARAHHHPHMRDYARQRLRALRHRQFFDTAPDTAAR